ncbi:SRPBCC domain-containing protein [Amycolatopsis sp. cg5]|uniref:SRPBCC family protein n=1 Tax=Amycolatopsis sp. cg5 TaxID=3238802 RepID=UPI003524C66A
MTEEPLKIEVTIAAPADEVWRAMRDPELIRRWHGWHLDSLDAEIQMIYVDEVTEDAENHVLETGGDRFSLHSADGGTVVRLTRGPRGANPEWEAYYDDITEGWRTFLVQLRFGMERHGLAERQTVFLHGPVPGDSLRAKLGVAGIDGAYTVTLATGDTFAGEVYARSELQIALVVDSIGLLIVADAPKPGGHCLAVLTTYDFGDFDAVNERWTKWFASLAE